MLRKILRKKDKISITRSALYSLGLHSILLIGGLIYVFFPKQSSNSIIMDVELIGEGEFKEDIANRQPLSLNSQNSNVPSITEIKNFENNNIEKDIPEDLSNEESAKTNVEKIIEPEEININEEAVPKIESEKEKAEEEAEAKLEKAKELEKEKNKKEQEKKKKEAERKKKQKELQQKKKRSKKALMNVIKNAEKVQKKKDYRKKMLDIAEKADYERMSVKKAQEKERERRNTDFQNIINDMYSGGKGEKGSGLGAFGTDNGLAESDYEMISAQIYPNWVVPSGVRDAENIIIEIRIELGNNGEVIPSSIKIVDEERYSKDYIFRAAADSARRAILQASPLSIPKEKLNLFRKITLRFNLKEALGE